MKDVIEISFSINVKASPLAKGVAQPIAKVFEKLIPYAERVTEAATKAYEAAAEKDIRNDNKQ